MSIKVPDDFEDCSDNVIEFLDGGSDTDREIMASVFSTIADTVNGLNFLFMPEDPLKNIFSKPKPSTESLMNEAKMLEPIFDKGRI